MRSEARDQLIVHAFAGEVLVRVLAVFAEAKIDVLAVKGVSTAYSLYASAAERPITDIDLRVRPADIDRVRDVGARARWKVLQDSPTYRNVVFELGGLMIDIEAGVGPPGVCDVSMDAWFARAEARTSPLGAVYRTPETHDHALLLAVNAFKDKMVHANNGAIEDLVRIVRLPSFDPAILIARARAAGSATLLWIVADWLAAQRADEVWRAIRDRIGPRSPRRIYARAFSRLLRTDADEALRMRVLARAVNDRATSQLRALYSLAKYWLEIRRQATERR